MSTRRRDSYVALKNQMERLEKKMEEKRRRISDVAAEALLTDDVMAKLAEYSTSDLKKIMRYIAADMDRYIVRLEDEKKAAEAKPEPAPQRPVQQAAPAQAARPQVQKPEFPGWVQS